MYYLRIIMKIYISFITLVIGIILYSSCAPDSPSRSENLEKNEISESARLNALANKWESKNLDSSLYYAELSYAAAEESGNTKEQIASLNNIGYSLTEKSEYAQAYATYKKALDLSEKTNDTLNLAKTYNFIGAYYTNLSEYEEAHEYFYKSYELRHLLNDSTGISITSGNIGLNYWRLKDYDLAEKYIQECITIDSIKNDSFYMINGYVNMGLVYKFTDRLDASEKITRRALEFSKALNLESDISLVLGNLGMIYLQGKQYDKAIEYNKKALTRRKQGDSPYNQLVSYVNLVKCYTEMGKYDLSNIYADSAAVYIDKVKNDRQTKKLLEHQIINYSETKDYKKAFEYDTLFRNLIIKSAEEERIKKLASVQAKLNLLETENLLFKKEAEVSSLRANRQVLIFGIIGLVLLFSTLYLLRAQSYLRRNEKLQKQYARDLIIRTENERKRISSELHDSIGQSLLLIKNKIFLNSEESNQDLSLVDNAIDEVRSLSQAIHPFQFEKLGLIKSLEYMIDQFQENSHIFYSHEIETQDTDIPKEIGIYIYRIVQECVNNVEKHSHAKACKLEVRLGDKFNIFVIKDNGKGFDLTENSTLLTSLGMKTLKERAQIIGGQLEIDSTKNKGTTITLKVPK